MKVLVTGGAGFLGSTICSALIQYGITPVILDSLITGRDTFVNDKLFFKGDIGDREIVKRIFQEHKDIEFLIHCAEKAAVDISVGNPYEYYNANVVKSLELFSLIQQLGCKKIIFISTAGLYDDVPGYMVTENSPINPRSPFTKTKYIMEMILKDYCQAYGMRCLSMRCFNPIGADPYMRSGIQPKNPTSIVGKLIDAVENGNGKFQIAGKDWGTRDGTCIRDYVHVWDAALAHVRAVLHFDEAFEKTVITDEGFIPINIGSGIGVTVKEFVFAFENVTGEKIQIEYGDRRPGDIAGTYANISRAKSIIGWEAKITIEEAILDAMRWEDKKRE